MTRSNWNPIRLGSATVLTDEGRRATVARVLVEDGPEGAPATVIVKLVQVQPSERESDGPTRAWKRFLSEVVALDFLGTLPTVAAVSPRLLAVDLEAGVLVLEDLGEGVSLADLLTGDDPRAAVAGLNAYARTLGRLQAQTARRGDEFASIVRKYSATSPPGLTLPGAWGRDEVPRFKRACEALDVPIDAAFDRELESIELTLTQPGPWATFIVSDACPDNHFIIGDTVRFFDFEFSGFGHALVDGAYLRLPFPTCWCASRLPPDVQATAARIYRVELAHGCPIAEDDNTFEQTMLMACARWTIATVSWTLERALREDDMWGLMSHRQRHVYRLETLVQQIESGGRLHGVGRVAAELAKALRTRWPEIGAEMPLYLAFRSLVEHAGDETVV
jgi:hypothetical protein